MSRDRGRKVRHDPTVAGFGDEWERFDQRGADTKEQRVIFETYFADFPWESLHSWSVGADIGAGTGRWAKLAAERVGRIFCIEPSAAALKAAQRNLSSTSRCVPIRGAAGELPFRPAALDFCYILGVLHHTPEPTFALADAVAALKPGAPMLIYVYYDFEDRPGWFRSVWKISNVVRRLIARQPTLVRFVTSEIIAIFVYFPLAKFSTLVASRGHNADHIPLSAYRDKSFYTMRTDALDRFGTILEDRYSRREIVEMMTAAGLTDISLSEGAPYWRAIGFRSEIG